MGDRVEIGGHPTWVEVRGGGDKTVVLLHGGVSNSDVMLDALSAPLEEQHYRVVAFDRRGHGFTADTELAIKPQPDVPGSCLMSSSVAFAAV